MIYESVLVNINKSRFVISHKFGSNLHVHQFPTCIEGDSVTLIETISNDMNGASDHF